MLTAARGGVVSWPLAAAEAKDLVHHRGQFAEADGSAGHGHAAGGAGAGAGAGTSPTTAAPRGTPGTPAQASPPPPPPVVPPRMYKPMGSQATDSQVAPPPIPPRPERVVTPPPPPLPPAGRGFGTIAGTTPHPCMQTFIHTASDSRTVVLPPAEGGPPPLGGNGTTTHDPLWESVRVKVTQHVVCALAPLCA